VQVRSPWYLDRSVVVGPVEIDRGPDRSIGSFDATAAMRDLAAHLPRERWPSLVCEGSVAAVEFPGESVEADLPRIQQAVTLLSLLALADVRMSL
jgi:hypothetical protein